MPGKRAVEADEAREYSKENGIVYMDTSAKSGLNVKEIFVAIGAGLGWGAAGGGGSGGAAPLPRPARRAPPTAPPTTSDPMPRSAQAAQEPAPARRGRHR